MPIEISINAIKYWILKIFSLRRNALNIIEQHISCYCYNTNINIGADSAVNAGIFAPINIAATNRTTQPKSCEIPVIQNGKFSFALLSLIIIEITVQTDAERIRISPTEKPRNDVSVFMAIIPQKPINAPIIFVMEKFSFFTNKNEKHANKSGPG